MEIPVTPTPCLVSKTSETKLFLSLPKQGGTPHQTRGSLRAVLSSNSGLHAERRVQVEDCCPTLIGYMSLRAANSLIRPCVPQGSWHNDWDILVPHKFSPNEETTEWLAHTESLVLRLVPSATSCTKSPRSQVIRTRGSDLPSPFNDPLEYPTSMLICFVLSLRLFDQLDTSQLPAPLCLLPTLFSRLCKPHAGKEAKPCHTSCRLVLLPDTALGFE